MSDFVISAEIREAMDAGQPLVALETALVTHGFDYPASVDITRRMAEAIREAGALPVVIGFWRGKATVGLSETQIEALAQDKTAFKVSVRDLPLMAVRGGHGGTTVAATALLAHRAGLRVFATGGIGGVHRGHPEDISADLPVLASTPIIVVCAGAKSLLDLPRTREYLETWGVPVIGWETDVFPAFYNRVSELGVDFTATDPAEIAAIYAAQRAQRLPQGLLVAAPVPAADEIPAAEVEPLIVQAVAEADAQGIAGRHLTPFILSRMVTLSAARTRQANESLLVNNARIAGHLAAALADETTSRGSS